MTLIETYAIGVVLWLSTFLLIWNAFLVKEKLDLDTYILVSLWGFLLTVYIFTVGLGYYLDFS